jgi:tetratricopeptide (TPR) repeat protein
MAEHFLEALMEIAKTFHEMGKLGEAKQRLELAVVLAGFLVEDESRLSVARALLADLLVTMGSIDDAKDNARASLRIAHKVRSAQPTIVSALALAETHLATNQWRDALDYAQEALDEAKRTQRTREVARARELRARAYLVGSIERAAANDAVQATESLNRAFAEVTSALDFATRADAVKEMLAARLTLARCHFQKGEDSLAEIETHAALELSESGAVGLSRLIGNEAAELPALLRSPDLDLVSLFASRKLDLPSLEWQAHYLKGTLLAKRLGPQAGYESLRDAARLVSKVLSVMTPAEAATFQQHNPDVIAVFDNLDRFAITDASRTEVRAILEGVARMNNGTQLAQHVSAIEA